MGAVEIVNRDGAAALVLSCEHGACAVPAEYDNLGLEEEQLREHIGWDIGARALSLALAAQLDVPAVLAGVSRLVIDCNRALDDHDLIAAESHGVPIPGNAAVDAAERQLRVRDFYQPYHDAVDEVLAARPGAFLFSVHSFTPLLNGRERRFDAGVLFDLHAAAAERLGRELSGSGFRVRYNQPYSGLDGLIFSARSHGQRHGLRYLELELNNALLRSEAAVHSVATRVATALRSLVSEGSCA